MTKKINYFYVVGSLLLLMGLFSITYAYFNYTKIGDNNQIIAGDIYFTMDEGNEELELSNVFPETPEEARTRDDNYITFTVNGKNTSNKAIYYEFILNYGTEQASPKSRYIDRDLKFDLVELDSNGNEIDYLLSDVSYGNHSNKRIYVDTVDANTTSEITRYYKLRMWLSEDVIISDSEPNANYTTVEFPNKYATIKLTVAGDFTEKVAAMPGYRLIQSLASTKSYIQSYDDIISSNPTFTTQDQVSTSANKQTVYYFTGDDAAANANVLFAGFCWQIIRTTDNGGVRMIYNGVAVNNKCETTREVTKGINAVGSGTTQSMTGASLYGRSFDYNLATGEFTIENSTGLPTSWSTSDANSNGIEDYKELIGTYTCLSSSATCTTLYYVGSYYNNTTAYVSKYTIGDVAHFSQMGTSAFNPNYYSPAMVGYMFNNEYDYKSGSKSGEYFTTATWNGTTYDLTSGNNGSAPDVEHHYICDTDCTKVRYYYYTGSYILLENGAIVEDAIYQMTGNGTVETKAKTINANYELNNYNSAMKGYLDNWYKKNLTGYTSYLDETSVYCNDRSIRELGGWNPTNSPSLTTYLQFYQNSANRDLNCVNEENRFAVTNNKAELTYPIGLLTEPERNLMTSNFAKTGQSYWGASPNGFFNYGANVRVVNASGVYIHDYVYFSYGARGVVTLKPSTLFESGEGTYTNPYVVGIVRDFMTFY